MIESKHNSIGHEADSTDVRAVGFTGLVLSVGVAIVLLAMYGTFQYLLHHRVVIVRMSPLAETDQQEFPPAPRIEEHPAEELMELRTREDNLLSTYGWMDKQSGVVRIPIDLAMELQLSRGFPVRKEAAAK